MKEIKSHSNEYIKMLKSLKRKKGRDDQGKYIVEGSKTIEEAVRYGQEIECILVSDKNSITAGFARHKGIDLIAVPYEIIQQIADTKSPPKEIACLKKQENLPDYDGNFYVAMDLSLIHIWQRTRLKSCSVSLRKCRSFRARRHRISKK